MRSLAAGPNASILEVGVDPAEFPGKLDKEARTNWTSEEDLTAASDE